MDLSRRDFLGWSAVGLAGLLVPSRELIRPAAKVFDMGRGLPIYRPPQFSVVHLGEMIPSDRLFILMEDDRAHFMMRALGGHQCELARMKVAPLETYQHLHLEIYMKQTGPIEIIEKAEFRRPRI